MHFLRTAGRGLLGSLISSLLLLVPIFFALHVVIGQPGPLKQALRDSGVYTKAVNRVVDKAATDNEDANTKRLLADPGIREAINGAFTPQLIQTTAETSIDQTYAWLNGKTDRLELSIATGDARQKLIQNLTAYANKRAVSLTPCTRAQLLSLNADSDVLTIPCLPPGTNPTALATEFGNKISGQLELPDEKKQQVTTSESNLKARQAFQLLASKFWVLPLLTIILALTYVLFHHDKIRGLIRLSRTVLVNGIVLGILVGISVFLFGKLTTMLNTTTPDPGALPMQDIIVKVVNSLAGDFQRAILIWAVSYIIVSSAVLITIHYRHKSSAPAVNTTPKLP